jgi:signal transduction histidine kinase
MTRILVIDDEAPLRESIVDVLTFEGFEVSEAADGLQGWELVRSTSPDLVVCDIAMPELDGYQLLLRLREDPATATLPFIFLTARADRPFMRHGMELGADDYLTKPFTNADLLAAIRARLERHAQLRQASGANLDELRMEFVRHVTHELRTPLVSLTTVQDIVEQQLGFLSTEELAELLHIQRSGSQRLHHLIEQTVLLTEIKTNVLNAEKIRDKGILTAIWDVLTPAINLARRFAYRNQEMPVYLDDRDGGAPVKASPAALRHAFAEVIANALYFSPADSTVRVTEWVEAEKIWVTVEDRGPGIPDEARAVALSEFSQIDRQRNEQQGLGLGLPLAQQIVRMHGGTLLIEANPGGGTKVIISLPLATELIH